jgi:hypothetical protein
MAVLGNYNTNIHFSQTSNYLKSTVAIIRDILPNSLRDFYRKWLAPYVGIHLYNFFKKVTT